MAKTSGDLVTVEALIRFPWKGKPYFIGSRFECTQQEADGLVEAKAAKIVGSLRKPTK